MKERRSNPLAPVSINGTRLKPKNAAHRKKLLALKFFVEQLKDSPAGKCVARVVPFGSVAKGTAKKDSDIDVLIFTRAKADKAFEDARYDAKQATWDKFHEAIEAHTYPLTELKHPTSYMVYRATRHGDAFKARRAQYLKAKEIRSRIKQTEEDLDAARDMLVRFARPALAIAYNAAECCAKVFILREADDLPGSRHGIVEALKRTSARAFVPRLRQALQWHIQAAYEIKDSTGPEETRAVIALAEEMLADLNQNVRRRK
jgi:hypothetical protein